MSFQPGRMGVAEGMALVFVTTFTSIFLTSWPLAIDSATTATWMLSLINGLIGIGVLYSQAYVLQNTSGDLYAACQELVGVVVTRLIAVYYIGIYLLDACLLLRQFAESTLLTALPELSFEIAVGWYVFLIVLILFIGIEAIARASYLFLPMAVLIVFIVVALLTPQYQFMYLAPWNGPGFPNVVMAGIHSVGLNMGILIPFILARSFQNSRTIKNSVLYGFGLSSFIKSLTLAAYIAAFGTGAAREKVFPFYEMARLVYINRYIQRIESLIIFLWAMMGILNVAIEIYIGLYLLGRLFNLPTLRPLIIPTALILAELAMFPGEIGSVIAFHHKVHWSFYNIGIYIIPGILFAAALLRARRRQSC
ncbi:MAG: spore germination protein [Firmicutes bacterium]|nr:spore germination protein [Bacillota bacterium]